MFAARLRASLSALFGHMGMGVGETGVCCSRPMSVLSVSSSPPRGRLPRTPLLCAGVKTAASDLRPGSIVELQNRLLRVVKAQHHRSGRGGASMQVDLVDLEKGSQASKRFRPDEGVEVAFVEDRVCTFLYREGKDLFVFADRDMQQFEVSSTTLGGARVTDFLRENTDYTLQLYDGEEPIALVLPETVALLVEEAEPNPGKHATKTASYKAATVAGGRRVMVPPFVEAGDEIVLRTSTGEYVSRAR